MKRKKKIVKKYAKNKNKEPKQPKIELPAGVKYDKYADLGEYEVRRWRTFRRWQCPVCHFETMNPKAMREHLGIEIKKGRIK